jgi:putative FmdB family regulatory protein
MPLYEYICTKCGKRKDVYKSVKEYDSMEICSCGYQLIKLPSKISLGFTNKFKDIEREANAKGRIIKEPGLAEDAKRNKEYQEQNRKREIRKCVEDVVSGVDI